MKSGATIRMPPLRPIRSVSRQNAYTFHFHMPCKPQYPMYRQIWFCKCQAYLFTPSFAPHLPGRVCLHALAHCIVALWKPIVSAIAITLSPHSTIFQFSACPHKLTAYFLFSCFYTSHHSKTKKGMHQKSVNS